MIELVFVACMIARPEACEERTLSFLSQGNGTMSCLMEGPPTLASWTVEHPGFRIGAWRCQDSGHRVERA